MMSPREFCLAGISGDGRPQLPAGTRGRPVSGRVQRDSQRSAPRWATKQPLCRRFSTGATGLEPATSGVTGRRRARSTTFDRPPARAGNHPGLSDPSSALPPATGYKTGTSARARAGTRGPRRSRETARSPGETCPGVPARARASLTCLSLVMKGSPVRVRASALWPICRDFVGVCNLLHRLRHRSRRFRVRNGYVRDTFSVDEVVPPSSDGFAVFAGDSPASDHHVRVPSRARV
jgi:hypothetical protein